MPFRLLPLFLFTVCALRGNFSSAEQFAFFHENVLGTSMELRIEAKDRTIAEAAESIALEELDRLTELFSQYESSSDFSRFVKLPVGESMQVKPELAQLLSRCEEWSERSSGAFNAGAELLCRRWKQGAQDNVAPSEAELGQLVQEISQRHWSVDLQTNTVTRLSTVPLSLNAIAKGTILDLVANQVMTKSPQMTGLSINIGGDIRIVGQTSEWVEIADPRRDTLGAPPLQRIPLRQAALATSGVSERSIVIGSQSYSHIVDPRSGLPCNQIVSASVIANDAETADVLATICSVLPAQTGIALIERIPGAGCLLVDLQGVLLASSNWPEPILQDPLPKESSTQETAKKTEATPGDYLLTFEINKASSGRRYRRPYLAAWIENKEEQPVKTLSLFLMTDDPGPRWHRDLRRWYAADQKRLAVDPTKRIGNISKPTRNPGVYKVDWNGKDDHDKDLPEGEYTLFIEAAREHGTYQLLKKSFTVGKEDFDLQLEENVEIKSASFVHKKSR